MRSWSALRISTCNTSGRCSRPLKELWDLAFTADDIAGQNGLLISLEMWEEFIKPCQVRLNRRIHEFGVEVIYHSDGAVMGGVAGSIDAGIDVLQALQFDAKGMDPVRLKEQYGDRLCFEGGISVQKTLPFGRPEDVRLETERLIRTLGRNGGYVSRSVPCDSSGNAGREHHGDVRYGAELRPFA